MKTKINKKESAAVALRTTSGSEVEHNMPQSKLLYVRLLEQDATIMHLRALPVHWSRMHPVPIGSLRGCASLHNAPRRVVSPNKPPDVCCSQQNSSHHFNSPGKQQRLKPWLIYYIAFVAYMWQYNLLSKWWLENEIRYICVYTEAVPPPCQVLHEIISAQCLMEKTSYPPVPKALLLSDFESTVRYMKRMSEAS